MKLRDAVCSILKAHKALGVYNARILVGADHSFIAEWYKRAGRKVSNPTNQSQVIVFAKDDIEVTAFYVDLNALKTGTVGETRRLQNLIDSSEEIGLATYDA